MNVRADYAIVGLGILLHVAALTVRLATPPHLLSPPNPTLVQRVAEALPHTHTATSPPNDLGETTGKIGYLDTTRGVVVLELESSAIVQGLVSDQDDIPRYQVGQRVRVRCELGHHGETLYTVTEPLRWPWSG